MVEEDEARARGEGVVNKNHRKEEHFTIARNLVRHQDLADPNPQALSAAPESSS